MTDKAWLGEGIVARRSDAWESFVSSGSFGLDEQLPQTLLASRNRFEERFKSASTWPSLCYAWNASRVNRVSDEIGAYRNVIEGCRQCRVEASKDRRNVNRECQ